MVIFIYSLFIIIHDPLLWVTGSTVMLTPLIFWQVCKAHSDLELSKLDIIIFFSCDIKLRGRSQWCHQMVQKVQNVDKAWRTTCEIHHKICQSRHTMPICGLWIGTARVNALLGRCVSLPSETVQLEIVQNKYANIKPEVNKQPYILYINTFSLLPRHISTRPYGPLALLLKVQGFVLAVL